MPDTDKLAYIWTIFDFLKHNENLYLQHRERFIVTRTGVHGSDKCSCIGACQESHCGGRRSANAIRPAYCHFFGTSPQPSMPSQVDVFIQITNRTSRVDCHGLRAGLPARLHRAKELAVHQPCSQPALLSSTSSFPPAVLVNSNCASSQAARSRTASRWVAPF
jgi:hypothetical protein